MMSSAHEDRRAIMVILHGAGGASNGGTLDQVARSVGQELALPNLCRLGLGNVFVQPWLPPHPLAVGSWGGLRYACAGSTTEGDLRELVELNVDGTASGDGYAEALRDQGMSGLLIATHPLEGFDGLLSSRSVSSNRDAMVATALALNEAGNPLIVTVLSDFFAKYGPRRNFAGFQQALEELDSILPKFLLALHADDLLVVVSTPGYDFEPTEPVLRNEPCFGLVYAKGMMTGFEFSEHGTPADLCATIAAFLGIPSRNESRSFAPRLGVWLN